MPARTGEGPTSALAVAVVEAMRRPIPDQVRALVLGGTGRAVSEAPSRIRSAPVDAIVAAAEDSEGIGVVALPGRSERVDRATAALVIGTAARNGAAVAGGRRDLLAPVLGALYAWGDAGAASAVPFTTAVAIGVEVAARCLHVMAPRHEDEGWDATGTVGAFGAAVAVGLVLGLDVVGMRNAIAIASSTSVGHGDGRGSDLERFHAGKAAQNGLLAATLAHRGFTGSPTALEGPRGYFRVIAEYADPSEVAEGFGVEWRLLHESWAGSAPADEAAVASIDARGPGGLVDAMKAAGR